VTDDSPSAPDGAQPTAPVPRDELPTLGPEDVVGPGTEPAAGSAHPPSDEPAELRDVPSDPTQEDAAPSSDDALTSKVPPSYIFFGVVAGLAAVLDLGSKEWASHALSGFDLAKGAQKQIDVVKGVFDLQYAQNPGGAWSMLRSLPEIWRRPFFLFVSTSASVFITSLYGRIDRRDFAMKWGLPLALGGAMGNLVDRIRRGYVVDFLHIFYERPGKAYHWPTFNVADVWIVVGVGMMALSLFFGRAGRHENA